VEGCTLASQPGPIGGIPEDIRPEFDVHPGADALRVQFHLHGFQPFRAELLDPVGLQVARGEAQGDEDHDSFLRFDVAKPLPGGWELRVELEEAGVARAWTALAIISY
jgi:hypothetical protein